VRELSEDTNCRPRVSPLIEEPVGTMARKQAYRSCMFCRSGKKTQSPICRKARVDERAISLSCMRA